MFQPPREGQEGQEGTPPAALPPASERKYRFVDPAAFSKDEKNPVVVVVDRFGGAEFGFPRVDIDGDGAGDIASDKGDLAHGEVIAKFVEALLPEAKIIRVSWPVRHLDADTSDGVAVLEELSRLKKAGYRIDAVNLSMSPPVPLTFDRLSEIVGTEITPENVRDHKLGAFLKLLSWAATDPEKDVIKALAGAAFRVMTAMTQLSDTGVKVYVSAGNNGPNSINLYAFARGVTTVSAVDARGVESEYSCRSSLNERSARGDFNVREVFAGGRVVGLDFTGDGKVDIASEKLSGKGAYRDATIAAFAGKPVSEVVASDRESAAAIEAFKSDATALRIGARPAEVLLNLIPGRDSSFHKKLASPPRLYSVRTLLVGAGKTEAEASRAAEKFGDYLHPSGRMFRKNELGRIVFSYDASPHPGIWEIHGTSFAAPVAMCEDLAKKRARK